MTGEEFGRLVKLGEIRTHLVAMRPRLTQSGVKDFWHLNQAERVLEDMLADPGAKDFRNKSLSLQWHLTFLKAEWDYQVKKNDEELEQR